MKRLFLSLLVLLTVVSLAFTGAAQEKVGLFICNMAHPYFMDMVAGAQDAAKALDVKVATFDAQDDPATQLAQIEDAIATGYDAILLNPTSLEAMIPAVEKANKAGIPVFTLDRDVAGGKRIAYIGTNNVASAELGARYLLSRLILLGRPLPWRIVYLSGTPGSSAAIERSKGAHNVLNPFVKAGLVKIVADLTAYFNRPKALHVMSDILATTTDIDAVLTGNDEMALGALGALKDAGLKVGEPDGVLIMGFDAIPDALAAIKKGDMIGTVAQAPYIMGYWGVEAAVLHIRKGWLPPKGTPVYGATGALHLDTGGHLVTAANVDKIATLVKTPPPLPGTK